MRATALALAALIAAPTAAFAFGDPKHSKVDVAVAPDGQGLGFTFTVKPEDGHKVTTDAPWKLEVKGADGLAFGKTSLGKGELDEKLPGYKLVTTAAPGKDGGELEWALTSFICTSDKTVCYREVHKGKTPWKAAAK